MSMFPPMDVFELESEETVMCFFCQEEPCNMDKEYKKGEAFLAGADHPPFDANANYICREHLADNATIIDIDKIKKELREIMMPCLSKRQREVLKTLKSNTDFFIADYVEYLNGGTEKFLVPFITKSDNRRKPIYLEQTLRRSTISVLEKHGYIIDVEGPFARDKKWVLS